MAIFLFFCLAACAAFALKGEARGMAFARVDAAQLEIDAAYAAKANGME